MVEAEAAYVFLNWNECKLGELGGCVKSKSMISGTPGKLEKAEDLLKR